LSLESRAVIPNMMAEFGAKTAYLPPDEAIFKYLEGRARRPYTPMYPDPDATYAAETSLRYISTRADGRLPGQSR